MKLSSRPSDHGKNFNMAVFSEIVDVTSTLCMMRILKELYLFMLDQDHISRSQQHQNSFNMCCMLVHVKEPTAVTFFPHKILLKFYQCWELIVGCLRFW